MMFYNISQSMMPDSNWRPSLQTMMYKIQLLQPLANKFLNINANAMIGNLFMDNCFFTNCLTTDYNIKAQIDNINYQLEDLTNKLQMMDTKNDTMIIKFCDAKDSYKLISHNRKDNNMTIGELINEFYRQIWRTDLIDSSNEEFIFFYNVSRIDTQEIKSKKVNEYFQDNDISIVVSHHHSIDANNNNQV